LLKVVKGNFFAIALSILMLLSFSTIVSSSVLAYATDNTVQVVIGNANGTLGSTVDVPINFTNVSNELAINNCDFVISYDVTKLSFEGVEPGSIIINPTEDFSFNNVLDSSNQSIGQVNFLFNDESNDNNRFIRASGVFATMKFKIKDITPGAPISIDVKSYGAFSLPDPDLTTRSAISTNGKVTLNQSGFTVNGRIQLEGDDLTLGHVHYSGDVKLDLVQGGNVIYTINSSNSQIDNINGEFTFNNVDSGNYVLVISKSGYLMRSIPVDVTSNKTITSSNTTFNNRIYLLAGDVVQDTTNSISPADMNNELSKFGTNSTQGAAFDPTCDILKDSTNSVSPADLNLILKNYGLNITQYSNDIVIN
jgi:hypothetical protein